jgi:hypothetical protein
MVCVAWAAALRALPFQAIVLPCNLPWLHWRQPVTRRLLVKPLNPPELAQVVEALAPLAWISQKVCCQPAFPGLTAASSFLHLEVPGNGTSS